jgi:uncharacterized protein (DUF1697 family)
MPALREALTEAGFEDVQTYLQSGNIVLGSKLKPAGIERKVAKLIEERFGLEIAVVVRTRAELAKVVERNPLKRVAKNPKRYQVSFLSEQLDPKVVEQLESTAAQNERVVAIGTELYAWHPDGVAASKLWSRLAGKGLGVTATARNWTTVTALLEMAGE